jgi:hypothetical protein
MTVKCSKWPRSIQNGHKIYQHFSLQGYPKYTKRRIFGMKIDHLATLGEIRIKGMSRLGYCRSVVLTWNTNSTRREMERIFNLQKG